MEMSTNLFPLCWFPLHIAERVDLNKVAFKKIMQSVVHFIFLPTTREHMQTLINSNLMAFRFSLCYQPQCGGTNVDMCFSRLSFVVGNDQKSCLLRFTEQFCVSKLTPHSNRNTQFKLVVFWHRMYRCLRTLIGRHKDGWSGTERNRRAAKQ